MSRVPPLRALTAGTGAPLVLLHGFGVTPLPYRRAIDALSDSFAVVAPWLVGGSAAWTFEGLLDSLRATLDHHDLADVHLVGHSFGGAVAVGLADAEPDRVRSVTLVDSMGISPGPLRMALLGLHPGNVRLLSPAMARDLLGYLTTRPRELAAAGWWAYRCNLLDAVRRLGGRPLGRHVLWGRHDTLLPPSFGAELAAALSASFTVVESPRRRAGHDWPIRQPQLFADSMRAVLHTAGR